MGLSVRQSPFRGTNSALPIQNSTQLIPRDHPDLAIINQSTRCLPSLPSDALDGVPVSRSVHPRAMLGCPSTPHLWGGCGRRGEPTKGRSSLRHPREFVDGQLVWRRNLNMGPPRRPPSHRRPRHIISATSSATIACIHIEETLLCQTHNAHASLSKPR